MERHAVQRTLILAVFVVVFAGSESTAQPPAAGQTPAAGRGDLRRLPPPVVQRGGGQVPVEPGPPRAEPPFRLTGEQQALVHQVLSVWERESAKISTFSCPFWRYEYDPVFGPGPEQEYTRSYGEIKYAKPDKGTFLVRDVYRFDRKKADYEQAEGSSERWMCDGKAVFEFNFIQKELRVRTLPVELRGRAIADGPLPFIFGMEADKVMERYWIRVNEITETDILLEAHPRRQADASNFRRVELILERRRYLPSAVQVFLPNGTNRTVYIFKLDEAHVNDPIERFLNVFQQPTTPLGWKKVVVQ